MLIKVIFTRILGGVDFFTGGENKDREMKIKFLRWE